MELSHAQTTGPYHETVSAELTGIVLFVAFIASLLKTIKRANYRELHVMLGHCRVLSYQQLTSIVMSALQPNDK